MTRVSSDREAPASAVIERDIEWADTDASGHYHNTVALKLAEAAETALLQKLGVCDEIYDRLPRVRVVAEYHAPLVFGDHVLVRISVARMGRTSILYRYEIEHDGELCADGELVAVLIDRPLGSPIPWSDRLRAILGRGL